MHEGDHSSPVQGNQGYHQEEFIAQDHIHHPRHYACHFLDFFLFKSMQSQPR